MAVYTCLCKFTPSVRTCLVFCFVFYNKLVRISNCKLCWLDFCFVCLISNDFHCSKKSAKNSWVGCGQLGGPFCNMLQMYLLSPSTNLSAESQVLKCSGNIFLLVKPQILLILNLSNTLSFKMTICG